MAVTVCQAQSILRPVPKNLFTVQNGQLKAGATSPWLWRFDATISPQTAFNWDGTNKQFVPTSLTAIEPALDINIMFLLHQ